MTVRSSGNDERGNGGSGPSESLVADILARVADGVVALDRDWRYTYVNEPGAALLGRDAASLIGRHIWTEFPEGIGQPFHAAYERAMREQVVVRFEDRYAPWDRWFENRVYPSADGITIFFSDVSERKRAERDLQQQLAELDAVHGAGRRLRDLQTPEALTASIIAILEESIGYHYAVVLTIEPGSGRLVPLAASRRGQDDEFERRDRAFIESMDPRVGEGIVGWVAEHGEAIRLGDAPSDARYRSFRTDIRSELCVPIIVGAEVLGVINVESVDPDAYSMSDQRVLETIAAQVGVALQNTRLVTALRRTARELESLHETALDLIERRSQPDLLEAVVRRAATLAGTENGFIYVVDEGGESATAVAGTGAFQEYVGRRILRGEGISGQAWARGEPIAVDDYATYPHAIQTYIGTPVGAGPIAAIPLVAERGVIGILGLGRPGGPSFVDADLAILGRFGQLATLAMESVRLIAAAEDELGRRKAAEAAVRAAEARYRALVEQLPGAVYLDELHPDGPRTIYVSPQIEAMLGYPPEWFYPGVDRWVALVHEEDRSRYEAGLTISDDRGPFQSEFRMIARDGRSIWVHDAWVGIGPPDGPAQFLHGILTDVTERHRLEQGLNQAVKMEAVGRLAGGIAHDFNNLLTAIGGYATLLAGSLEPGDDRRPDAEAIVATTDRAAELVRRLLAFSRPQVEAPVTLELNASIVDVEGLIRQLIGADIALSTHLEAGVGHVRVDPTQLEQVLVNLAVNARDAMPNGGTLSIATSVKVIGDEAAVMTGASPGRFAVIEVRDSGGGMDQVVLARLFEPFFTTKEPGRGTGLGLATVYSIVAAAGGRIEVSSEAGAGTTFTVSLPSVPGPSNEGRTPDRTTRAAPGGTERILVIEDEDSVRHLAVRALTQAGYAVLEAADGAEALRVAGATDGPLDLILSDVIMPGVGGGTAVADIHRSHPRARALFMTGYADPRTLAALGGPVIDKPFTPRTLVARVRAVLDDAAEPRSLE